MKKEENQGKNTTRSLKELIYQLYEVAHEESFAVKKETIPELIEELHASVKIATDMEYVDFVRLKNIRALLERSVAIWSTEIQQILTSLRSQPEYKKMVTAHKGVLRISSSNLFTNILLDRFTSPESFVLRDYQIVISKFKSNQNQEMQQGEWYKLTGDQAHRYAPKCNEEGTFQRRDGNLIICVEIKKSPFRRLPDYSF